MLGWVFLMTAMRKHAVHPQGPSPSRRAPVRLPVNFFVVAVIFFAVGITAGPFIVPEVAGFFYQPYPLALVHSFTLGWISSAIMGVMYRYVPALTRRPIRFPRIAVVQLVLYIIGVAGMVVHFAIGVWVATWLAASVVVLSAALFALNIFYCLGPRFGDGVAETGMFLGTCFLLVAAVLGFLLGLDKSANFLGGSVLTNLAAHAHLAALGWVTLTICSVSYRFLPAFLLPKIELPRQALWQIYGLAVGVLGLAASLFFGLDYLIFWGVVIALSLLSYFVTVGRIVGSRRMPIDWTPGHALAGIAWLIGAIVLGLLVARTGSDSLVGTRIAAAYGTLGLLGFVSNFIIGMSYQLFPGFVARVRPMLKRPPATIAELSLPKIRPYVFVLFNAGVAVLASGLLSGRLALAQTGALLIAAGGWIFVSATLWTLSFAYRSALPSAAAKDLLRILPQ